MPAMPHHCRHLVRCCRLADELQRNIDRLTSELHATRLERQQVSEELLALHEHADLETAQVVMTAGGWSWTCDGP